MTRIKKILTFFLLSTVVVVMSGCSYSKTSASSDPLSETNFYMGTVMTISLYDKKDPEIIKKAFDRIKQIESEVSINEEKTEVDKVNEAAGKNEVVVGNDTYSIVKNGLYYSEKSGGSFDITIGPIVKLWSIGLPEAKVPTQAEIDEKLKLVGYKDLVVNDEKKSVYLKRKGMIIDLGGIAKGYTADEVKKVLNENGVNSAIIDLGGNILTIGKKPDGSMWRVGIQDPFSSRGQIIGTIEVENKSVVTSGIYERYIEKDGKKYHHILSPFNGYPFDNEIAGVTIISDKSVDGDGLSTSVFSKGLKGGLDFIENFKGVEAIFVTKNKEVYVTSGIKDIFKLTNGEFKLMN